MIDIGGCSGDSRDIRNDNIATHSIALCINENKLRVTGTRVITCDAPKCEEIPVATNHGDYRVNRRKVDRQQNENSGHGRLNHPLNITQRLRV